MKKFIKLASFFTFIIVSSFTFYNFTQAQSTAKTITFPVENQVLNVGGRYEITWNTKAFKSSEVFLLAYDYTNSGENAVRIASDAGQFNGLKWGFKGSDLYLPRGGETLLNAIPNSGKFTWVVPETIPGRESIFGNKIKIVIIEKESIVKRLADYKGTKPQNETIVYINNPRWREGQLFLNNPQLNRVIIEKPTLLSPNGNENLQAGLTHEIKWNSSDISNDKFVKIELTYPDKRAVTGNWYTTIGARYGQHTSMVVPNTGSYYWSIPYDVVPGDYLMSIKGWDSGNNIDYSDSTFSIKKSETMSENRSQVNRKTTLLKPNLGETWFPGNKYQVSWSTTNGTYKPVDVIIMLIDANNTGSYKFATDSSDTPYFFLTNNEKGYYDIDVPSDIKPGKYYVTVIAGTSALGTSVLPITISDSKITPPVQPPASPYIDSISPSSARIGDRVTIYGRNFNNAEDQISISNGTGGDLVVNSTFKTDTTIWFNTPTTTPNVTYLLTILSKDGKEVAPVEFTILPKTPPTSILPCFNFTRDLSYLDKGVDVTALQKFLSYQGYNYPSGFTDTFGGYTVAFIGQYQEKLKIPWSGKFDLETRKAINKLCGYVTYSTPVLSPTRPYIDSISPSSARVGELVTIYGRNFNNTHPDVTINTDGMTRYIKHVSKSDTAITFLTPGFLPNVTHLIGVMAKDGKEVAPVEFTIIPNVQTTIPAPAVSTTSITYSLASVVVGETVTIYGQGFENVDQSRVLLSKGSGETTVTFISSTPNKIVFKVPSVPAGQYKLSVIGDRSTATTDLYIKLTASTQEPPKPVTVPGGSQTSSVTITTNTPTSNPGNVIFDSVGPTDGVYYKWNIFDSNGVNVGTVQNGNIISRLYYNFTNPGSYSVNLSVVNKSNGNVINSNTLQVRIVNPNQIFKPQTINPVPPPATPTAPTTGSPTSQASGVPVSITSYENKTTFTTGNVIFDAVGPTDGVYYRWNITNSSGVTTGQQNGEVISKMYWNFTTPGTYKVNLSVLQKGTDNLVGTSNTITVTITSGQNGASTITIFDWFINLFR
jgi:hypothetical protein